MPAFGMENDLIGTDEGECAMPHRTALRRNDPRPSPLECAFAHPADIGACAFTAPTTRSSADLLHVVSTACSRYCEGARREAIGGPLPLLSPAPFRPASLLQEEPSMFPQEPSAKHRH